MHCDILIIGAGPAGSSAGIESAKSNLNILMIDKRISIGEPLQCAEYIPKFLLNEIDISRNSIIQEIDNTLIYFPDNTFNEFKTPGYILNRVRFDKELAANAVINGVNLKLNTKCISKELNKVCLKSGNIIEYVTPRIIIGADGPLSITGSWINSQNKHLIYALQHELPIKSFTNTAEIYFSTKFKYGYGWFFPKGKTANVGIGVINSKDSILSIKTLLKDFSLMLQSKDKVIYKPISTIQGYIPVGGPLNITVKENIVLAGDSAGQTNSITGGGIPQAIICGKIAGKIASDSLLKNDINFTEKYETEWRKIYGTSLSRAYNKRIIMENNWDNLNKIINMFWPYFKEYYD